MLRVRTISACFGALALAAVPCAAEFSTDFTDRPEPAPDRFGYAWSDTNLASRIGVGMVVGGGATGFTTRALRDMIRKHIGGAWNVRATIGTHIPLGVELTYFGSLSELQTRTEARAAWLIGTTFEAALRFTVLPHADSTPYIFAGAGWQRYNVRNPQVPLATLNLRAQDDVVVFPVGAGIAYREPTGWGADIRGTFRATTVSTLRETGGTLRLNSWEATAAVGYEF